MHNAIVCLLHRMAHTFELQLASRAAGSNIANVTASAKSRLRCFGICSNTVRCTRLSGLTARRLLIDLMDDLFGSARKMLSAVQFDGNAS